jgi:ubiquinone/menaquinone biosynthesis C-methylase UbiE
MMRPGFLHPSRLVTAASSGAAAGRVRRWVVRRLYNHLAQAYPLQEWTTMNYGYAALPGEAPLAAAPPADAAERNSLQLYARVASSGRRGAALGGLDVLEVGSGRGGGAAFVAAAMGPRGMTGLDVAAASATLASIRYGGLPNLTFIEGDAENLMLPDARYDIVLSIESAHCYASVARFLAEAARVLRPGGELLFAGFASRRGHALKRLAAAFRDSPLVLDRLDDITANIVASLRLDEVRKRELIGRAVSPPFRSFATGAYAMEGTAMRRALEAGETAYVAAVLFKASGPVE